MKSTASHSLEILEARIAPATLYALTESNSILRFDSATPGTIDATLGVTGLGAGEVLRGIDFRPATSELLGITVADGSANNSTVRTYRIDPETAVATLVGAIAAPLPGAGDVPTGLDFNPTVDRMRYVNTNLENARFNPNNALLAGDDTNLTASVEIIGEAYDRNVVNGGGTTLFAINRNGSQLSIQGGIDGTGPGGPNAGTITNVGSLNITLSAAADGGFDIEPLTGTAYAALTNAANETRLYTINLTTGAATGLGLIGNGATPFCGLAVAMPENLTIVNDRTATYTDEDGDRVTVKVSKGALEAGDFGIAVYANGGGGLRFLDLSDDGTEFDGANLSITARKAPGGDGLAHVGFIKARNTATLTGIDLGTVTVQGDLGLIDVGDTDGLDTALSKLSVRSLGRYGIANVANTIDSVSNIFGGLFTLDVKGDVFEAQVDVGGISGRIGIVKIGGSLIGGPASGSGSIVATSNIGKVTIDGDVIGGDGALSGRVAASGLFGSLTIGGSIRGGSGDTSGHVISILGFRMVKVKGDVVGGTGSFSGLLQSFDNSGPITIGGSLKGSSGFVSGGIIAGADLGPVKIGGDLLGGEGDQAGRIFTGDQFHSLSIGGSLIGGGGSDSGEVTSIGNIGAIKIGRDFIGGSVFGADANFNTGYIQSLGRIASISVGGSIISGIDDSTGTLTTSASIRVAQDIGSLTVKGSILGNAASSQLSPVIISAVGQATPGATSDLAIGKIAVGGRVERAQILAGYSIVPISPGSPLGLAATNGNASIGAVKVGRDWIASDLVAGIQDDADAALDDAFGDADDQLIPGFGGDALVARIASIAIKGVVIGNGNSPLDRFGFTAEQIGSFTASSAKFPLTAAANTFTLSPLTNDVTLRDF